MHQTAARLFSAIALLLVAGCASLPKNTTVNYFLTTTDVQLTVVRTVGCDSNKQPLVASTVTVTPINRADVAKPRWFDLADQRAWFADGDVKFDLTEDGRLVGVNETATGQGGPMLKTLGSLVLTGLAQPERASSRSEDYGTECKLLTGADGSKPVSITYEATLPMDWTLKDGPWLVPPTASGGYYAKALTHVLGSVWVRAEQAAVKPAPPVQCGWTTDHPAPKAGDTTAPRDPTKGLWCRMPTDPSAHDVIHASQPALVTFTVYDSGSTLATSKEDVLWTGIVPVAQFGTEYEIPVQSPPAFGVNTLALSFTDSGALKSVNYVNKSGAGQILDAADATLTKAQNENATEAANVKAKADLIAQQQRLVACETGSKDCKP